ncbi:MAG: helix-turn-helix transcriptional regulator, partial [Bacteroidetes bacterium]|nr:helix-turn-helix transcriptional regulator [Bacteroidota bacterium]
MNSIVSKKIKSGRKLRSLSQQKLADEIGVSKQMISKYENSISIPSSKVLIELAKALQLNVDYFFTPPTVELGTINFRKKSKLTTKRLESIKEEVK